MEIEDEINEVQQMTMGNMMTLKKVGALELWGGSLMKHTFSAMEMMKLG